MVMKGLSASAYQGMTPEQIAQTRSLGQQDTQQAMSFAKALSQAGINQEQLTLQQQQLEETKRAQRTQEKMQVIETVLNQKMGERKHKIEAQRADAYSRMAEAQARQADSTVAKHQKEIQQADNQARLIEDMQNFKVPTNMGEINLGTAYLLQSSGLDVKIASEDSVVQTFVGDDGSVRALAIINGRLTETDEFEHLQGMLPAPHTEIQDVRTRSREQSMGTEEANIKSAKWVQQMIEDLQSNDRMGFGLLMREAADNPEAWRSAVITLRETTVARLEGMYGTGRVGFGEQDGRRGFYTLDDEGNLVNFIRGDVINNIPKPQGGR